MWGIGHQLVKTENRNCEGTPYECKIRSPLESLQVNLVVLAMPSNKKILSSGHKLDTHTDLRRDVT